MSSITFIGLGIMGLPMARNLARAGHDVTGVVRSDRGRARAAEAGLAATDDAVEAAKAADVVITMLPDSPDVRSVVSTIGPHLREGALLVDMSTIDPVATRDIRAEALPGTVAMLDAPVSGGEAGAIDGVLSIMVGGDAADVERARPLFEVMGTTVVHVGPLGSGQVVKAANQLIVAGNIQMVAEAVVFLRAQGADLTSALQVIGGGLAGSTVLERKRQAFLDGSFTPGFRLALHAKDLGIVQNSAAAEGLALPLTAAVTQLVRALVARGDGELDHSALLKLAQELNGQDGSTTS
ncbi:NAD(P)-dependent oxidoreductase [Modestobacter sp. VKM Ac-2985]|uniref:NAD(P)-dependent oxidoreductase n=1 Tax=Modestobacter sp. VKM Ac-2985 TaxID=3004139 RepID=UPI0022AB98DD|nr:prephenate dehydrogenase/arogenate dehydrogenase family protein [Modestobacter sp. VKM Ac-2985]MCZ2840148.1 prephenate dehydrogenase/arogenate dehydrogenase family protein [Modestobacter sp. VKM Ac-2985]